MVLAEGMGPGAVTAALHWVARRLGRARPVRRPACLERAECGSDSLHGAVEKAIGRRRCYTEEHAIDRTNPGRSARRTNCGLSRHDEQGLQDVLDELAGDVAEVGNCGGPR